VTDMVPAEDAFPVWTVRRSTWFLVAIHLPFVVITPTNVIARRPDAGVWEMALIAAAAAAAGCLQLRHSLAAASRRRPAGWPLTFAVLVLLVYVPGWWLTINWLVSIQWFVTASAAMLLPRRVAVAVWAASIGGTSAGLGIYDYAGGYSPLQSALFTCCYAAVMAVGAAALLGSARLAAILTDLFAARTELAGHAVLSERLRMSRDLHDLLGHSLAAVSLKGDLAMRLLARDPDAAHREIEDLTSVARSALRDMRAVTHAEHDVSLHAEAESAQAVLAAAGVRTNIDVELPGLSARAESVLGWAVREGTTNILRHSQATNASITTGRGAERAWVQIVNDGAGPPPASAGSGLAGLAERAATLGGTAVSEHCGGEFRLRVEIPADAP